MRVAGLALLGVLVLAGIALALSAVARAGPPGLDAGMDGQPTLLVEIRSDFTVLEAGSALPMRIVVVEQHGVPVAGASVQLAAAGVRLEPFAGATNADGVFRFTLTAEPAYAGRVTVSASVSMPGAVAGYDYLDLTVAAPPSGQLLLPRQEAVSVGLGAIVAVAVLSTEFGRYGVFKLLVFPLYTRLKKEEVLDHFVRGQIYGYIVSHPGQHYNMLRQGLKVTNGTLSHHLRTLEMMGFIKAYRDGVFKRFYPIEMSVPQEKGVKLSDLQIGILELIRGGGGPTQAEIAARLSVTQQTVSYNIRALSREGAVRMEKDGRNTRYYPHVA